jgi:hypothetical protein
MACAREKSQHKKTQWGKEFDGVGGMPSEILRTQHRIRHF